MRYTIPFEALGRDDLALAGGKGANLGELRRAGLPVPPGFVVATPAYDDVVRGGRIEQRIVELATLPESAEPAAFDGAAAAIRILFDDVVIPEPLVEEITAGYLKLGDEAVAVRSSATAEDLAGASFAGQQDTYLNVRGAGGVLAAVRACWASLWTARAMAYRARQHIAPDQVSLAVVVQAMVEADSAGVMFTANPANGRRGELVIGAAWGLGESVVSGSVNTDDLVLDRATGRLVSRTVADKTVMTVYTGEGTRERPVPEELRREPVLDDGSAAELARYGALAEAHFGAPQDIEWVRADGEFFLVQSRPITSLPDPVGETPTDWSVPEGKAFYVRASIVEQLPDPLSPLFADLVDASVSRSLNRLVNESLGGRQVLRAGDVGLPTVNGYAYYRYTRGAFARLLLASPGAMRMVVRKGKGGARQRWRDEAHPRYVEAVRGWAGRAPAELTDAELLAGARALLDAGTEYYTSVQTIIPIAATSEVAFSSFYNRAVRRSGDPAAQTFLLGFDSAPIRAEKSLYDLAGWTREHPELTRWALDTPGDLLGAGPADVEGWDGFRTRVRAHLDRFGHAVYNLDFVNAVLADAPAPLFDTLRFYLHRDGVDPYRRQRAAAERRERETAAVLARLDPPRRTVFRRLLRWAQDAAPVREDALADVGLGWPTIRRLLLELGTRLRAAGVVAEAGDVFWLTAEEIGGPPVPRAEVVEQRRTRWRGQRRATPPQLLPEGTWRMMHRFMPASTEDQSGDVLRGVAASAGVVTAPARVLAGPADFARMRPGEVLVAAITTPAWTSLFAMAAAVVTDVGGPLSHSSIVAREYGIPAVLGTAAATRRIRDGQLVRVDGEAGTVTLLDDPDDDPEPAG
jgi:pyruvate,water dikinase